MKHQIRATAGDSVPGPHRGAYPGQAASRDPGLTSGLDGEANAAAAVELPPADGQAVVETLLGASRQRERRPDRDGALRRLGLEVVGGTLDARRAIGDPAAEAGGIPRQPRADAVRGRGVAGQGHFAVERRLAHQEHPLPGSDLEEQAEGELDRAPGVGQRIEEEQHAVSLSQHRQAGNPRRHATGENAAGLAHDDRAAGDEALEDLLDLEGVVRDAVQGPRHGANLAEHDDLRAFDHGVVGGEDVDEGGGRGGEEGGGQYGAGLAAGAFRRPTSSAAGQRTRAPSGADGAPGGGLAAA